MSQESLDVNGVETVPETDEIIRSRERFYVPATLENNDVYCGDEREPDTDETYLHVFGGVLNSVYNIAVMQEATKPGSITSSFEDAVRTVVPVVITVAKVRGGVHSDDHAEHAGFLDTSVPDGPVGCGYAGLRKEISQAIVDKREPIIKRAHELRPELFENDQDTSFATEVVSAHERLINRNGFLTSGRQVVLAAAEQGAKTMLVRGSHSQHAKGIINLDPDSTLRSDQALQAGLPTYDQDSWATEETNNRLRHLYPYDAKQQKIAELLDTIGTLVALGVPLDDIAVRRPAA